MDETRRRLGPRAVLGVVAFLLVAAVFWAASALATGRSASNEQDRGDSPAAADVQSRSEPDHRECPDGDRASDSGTAL
jgi:hypothetical protein